MSIQMLTSFFMWCTILNGGLLIFSSLVCAFAGNWVYGIHSRLFPMTRETFNVVIYSLIGLFKIIFLVFNVVPLVTLLIMG